MPQECCKKSAIRLEKLLQNCWKGKIVWRKNGNILKTQLKKADAQILVLEEQLVSLAQLQQKKSNAPTSTATRTRHKKRKKHNKKRVHTLSSPISSCSNSESEHDKSSAEYSNSDCRSSSDSPPPKKHKASRQKHHKPAANKLLEENQVPESTLKLLATRAAYCLLVALSHV